MKKKLLILVILTITIVLVGCQQKPLTEGDVLQPPEYSLVERQYETPQTLTIKPPKGKNVKVYYTLDGSDPSPSSTLYKEPLLLEKSVQINSIAVDEGGKQSAIVSAFFKFVDRQAQTDLINAIAGQWTDGLGHYYYFGKYMEDSEKNTVQYRTDTDSYDALYRVLQVDQTSVSIEIYEVKTYGMAPGYTTFNIETGPGGDGIIHIHGMDWGYVSDEPLF